MYLKAQTIKIIEQISRNMVTVRSKLQHKLNIFLNVHSFTRSLCRRSTFIFSPAIMQEKRVLTYNRELLHRSMTLALRTEKFCRKKTLSTKIVTNGFNLRGKNEKLR
jgi:hypothetical protein